MPRPSSHRIHPRERVLSLLRKANEPMTAYALLEKLQPHGIKAPPVVYRALKELSDQGRVHKIQATNSFIACDCEDDHDHGLSVLAICDDCRKVEELHDRKVIHHFEKLNKMNIRLAEKAVIELPILCENCAP